MENQPNYIEINRALWDKKAKHHISSAFYNMDNGGFVNGETSLKEIELGLLGDVTGKSVLHLQCHFGQDTLSLARMGAITTGIDFSGESIKQAEQLNEQLGLNARFICSDIYELPKVLDEQFDIVFTTYGVIGWLPDMQRWANIVSRYLKPGGTFVFVEFHPVVWMMNYDFTTIGYSYFNREPIVEMASGSYAEREADIHQQEIGWNHDLGEVLQSLLNEKLTVKTFAEYDYSPYNCFKNMTEAEPGRYRVIGLEGKLPMAYSLTAVK